MFCGSDYIKRMPCNKPSCCFYLFYFHAFMHWNISFEMDRDATEISLRNIYWYDSADNLVFRHDVKPIWVLAGLFWEFKPWATPRLNLSQNLNQSCQ